MADLIYNNTTGDAVTGIIDLDGGNIWAMIVTDAYVPTATHSKRSNITNEVVGTGYTAGGKILPAQVVNRVGSTSTLDADDMEWLGADFTGRGVVLYQKNGGLASADPVLMYLDFGVNKTASGGAFDVLFDPTGILDIKVGP